MICLFQCNNKTCRRLVYFCNKDQKILRESIVSTERHLFHRRIFSPREIDDEYSFEDITYEKFFPSRDRSCETRRFRGLSVMKWLSKEDKHRKQISNRVCGCTLVFCFFFFRFSSYNQWLT